MRHTQKTLRVLRVFLDHPDQRLYGLDVGRMAGFNAGTIYPALAELEQAGWVLSDWDPAPLPPGRKYRRRLYWLNPTRDCGQRFDHWPSDGEECPGPGPDPLQEGAR